MTTHNAEDSTAAREWRLPFDRRWLGADTVAGLVAAAVVIPKAMAYATIAGLPVQIGLYTALVPMVIYALLGTSRPLSVSTTTTIAILSAAALGEAAPNAAAADLERVAALAIIVGAMLVLASASDRFRRVHLGPIDELKSGIGFVSSSTRSKLLESISTRPASSGIAGRSSSLPRSSLLTLGISAVIVLLLRSALHATLRAR